MLKPYGFVHAKCLVLFAFALDAKFELPVQGVNHSFVSPQGSEYQCAEARSRILWDHSIRYVSPSIRIWDRTLCALSSPK